MKLQRRAPRWDREAEKGRKGWGAIGRRNRRAENRVLRKTLKLRIQTQEECKW
jgi:hypothetical protein